MRDHTPSVDHILYNFHPLEVWIAHLFLIVQRDYLWSERPQASFRNLLSETVLFHFFRSSWNCGWMCCVCVKQGPHVEEVVSSYMYRQAMEGNTWNTCSTWFACQKYVLPSGAVSLRQDFPSASGRDFQFHPTGGQRGCLAGCQAWKTRGQRTWWLRSPLKGQWICLEDSDRPETWIKYDKIGFLNCDILEFQWFLKRPGASGGPQSLGLIHPTWRSSSTAARCAKFVTVWVFPLPVAP